ncbi:MAG: hypothetical protein WDZ91_01560 [Paenibacillaceae bacterium]
MDPQQSDTAELLPFQVISVVRRGYMQGQGAIVRKAQVVTLANKGGTV